MRMANRWTRRNTALVWKAWSARWRSWLITTAPSAKRWKNMQSAAKTATRLTKGIARRVDNLVAVFAKRRKDRNEVINATRNAFRFTLLGREPRGDRMLAK